MDKLALRYEFVTAAGEVRGPYVRESRDDVGLVRLRNESTGGVAQVYWEWLTRKEPSKLGSRWRPL